MFHLYPFYVYVHILHFFLYILILRKYPESKSHCVHGKIKNFLRTIDTYARSSSNSKQEPGSTFVRWASMLILLIATLIFSSTEFTCWPQRVMPNIELQRVSEKRRKRNGLVRVRCHYVRIIPAYALGHGV